MRVSAFIIVFILGMPCWAWPNSTYQVTRLDPGKIYTSSGNGFDIYCHEGQAKAILYIWRSVYLQFVEAPSDYKLYGGQNDTEVYEKYNSETLWHPNSWIPWRDVYIDFPVFAPYCVGVKSSDDFKVLFIVRSINYWKVLQMVLGVVMFLSSPTLSKNVIFHYASGIFFGVIASVLILLYVISRFIPKKGVSYALMAVGYSVVFYFLQQLYFYSMTNIFENYATLFIAYTFFSAFISFVVCYRLGPVQDARTFRIIQWTMQCASILLMFFSTEYREMSTVMILLLLAYNVFPSSWVRRISAIKLRYFPPKLKLLSESEYIEQGNRETKRALEDLREFCTSPKCKTWALVQQLDDPKRFADFVEGYSHLTDDEILVYYDHDDEPIDITDDEDDKDKPTPTTSRAKTLPIRSRKSTSRSSIGNHLR